MLSFSIEQTEKQETNEEQADETEIDKPLTVFESFQFFIENLPQYWIEKKFTIPNLSRNYNEIINESDYGIEKKSEETEQPSKTGKHTAYNLIDEFRAGFAK